MLTFATQEPFFATLIALITIWAMERIVVAFINRNKPEAVECDCIDCDCWNTDNDDDDDDGEDQTKAPAINEEPF